MSLIFYGFLVFKDCQDAYSKRYRQDGIFTIDIPGIGPSKVRCDMINGGRIVFQRRVDATVDFYRNWTDYRNGFGNLTGNFWLGLEKLHKLAAPGKAAKLDIVFKYFDHPDVNVNVSYSLFAIFGESDGYRLSIGGFVGKVFDGLAYHNDMNFSTVDRDQDVINDNCAVERVGAWWYKGCAQSNLNGLYPPSSTNHVRFMTWDSVNCIFSEMKISY